MATAKDIRLLNIGMDKDSEERFMAQGRYRDAQNMRLITMLDGDFSEGGKLRSMDGHIAFDLSAVVEAGDIFMGAFEDLETEFSYIFIAGATAADDKIISFDPYNVTTPAVLLVESQYLNFDPKFPVLDAYKFDDILIFNDNNNPPRQINVTRSYAGLDNNEFKQATSIIQRPPLYAPSLNIASDTSFTGNNIIDKFFQFKYRYVYEDNAKSVFSPISAPAYSDFDSAHPDDIDSDAGMLNVISVKMLIDNADTMDDSTDRFPKKVELAVREGNSGDFFSVDTLDCDGVTSVTYAFMNDGTYTPIALRESGQLMDDVPLKAGAQGVSEGRILWGDVTRGYDDTTDIDMTPNVILRDIPTPVTDTGTSTDMTILDDAATFLSEIQTAVGGYTFKAGDKFTLTGSNTGAPAFQFGQVVVQSLIGWTIEDVYNEVITTKTGYFNATLDDTVDTPEGTYENTELDIIIVSASGTQTGFKAGQWYRSGIVYEDDEGRQQGVYTNEPAKLYIPHIAERSGITGAADTNAGVCAMGFLIDSAAPTWATRYKLAITPERVSTKTIQLFVSGYQIIETDLIELDLVTLNNYANKYDRTNVAYTFENGDRIRFITNGTTANWHTSIYDFEIVKAETKIPLQENDGVNTVYVHTEPTYHVRIHAPGITKTTITSALVEIYNPSKSLEEDQGIWYEIPGNSRPISSLAHQGIANQIINESDDYANTTPDALVDDSLNFKRVRFNYDNTRLLNGLPSVGSNNLVIAGLGTTDADWNGTYDITGYDVQESYVDVIINLTGSVGTATTSLTNCITSYVVTNSPALLTVSSFNAYGRSRFMVDVYTAIDTPRSVLQFVESQYMNDFSENSKILFTGRPAAVLNVRGEKRDKATVLYTEPYIFNTEINGIGRVYPDVNFEEYNHKQGAITKLHTRDDGILMLQERKTSKLLVNKAMIYSADGGGSLTTSESFLSRQIPFVGDFGCSNPESFASYGYFQFFADTLNGTIMQVNGDQLKDISDTGMMRWFRTELKVIETANFAAPNRYKVLGVYDPVYEEYVVSLRDSTGGSGFKTLAFSTLSNSWVSFYQYDPYVMFVHKKVMFSGRGQNMFAPTSGVPGKLFGTYYTSTVNVISNIEPTEHKNFLAIDLDANKAPVVVTIVNQDGQGSSLALADFVERESRFQSYILRDHYTPDVSTPLLYGDTIKSKSLSLTFIFTNAIADGVEISNVAIIVSKA
jgi:hypothetical protein